MKVKTDIGYVRETRGKDPASRIRELTDMLEEAVLSEKNQARGKVWPQVVFVLEEPIATAQIFKFDANRYFSDPAFYIEQTLRAKLWLWDNFPTDETKLTMNLPAWLNYYPEFTFVGLNVAFTHDGVPIVQTDHPLSKDPDLSLLQPVDFQTSGWMPRVLHWLDDLNTVADKRLEVVWEMFWWRGCLDLAIQLRGYQQLVLDMVDRPEFVHDLLKWLVDQRIHWYSEYYRYFNLPVSPVVFADDWNNVPFISPSQYEDFCLPRYLEIEQYHKKLVSFHSCGNQAPLQKRMLGLESLEIFENSAWMPLEKTIENLPPDKHLQIAVHPNSVLFQTEEQMEVELCRIADLCEGRSWNINSSGLTPILDSVRDYIDQINGWIGVAQKVLANRRHPVQEGRSREGEHHFHSLY